jgi:integrase/recombinase XerD
MLVFSDVLPLESAGKISIDQIRTAADLWVGSQPYAHNVTDGRHGRLRFISDAKQWLGFLGRLHLPEVPPRPYADLVDEFADYMIRQRGLSRHTVRIHCWRLRQFLDRFSQQHLSFSDISIRDIDAAVVRKSEQDFYARTSIKGYVSTLRAFFHYAEQCGWCTRGLASAIMAPRVWADESLPKGPSWDDVQRLLRSTEGDQPKNIRDRAIIMLFAVYGMRVGEVRVLTLEELNWEKELIYVTRPKPRRQQSYPLSYVVGEAILRYLKEVRPRVSYREVFLTLKAPIRPLGSGAQYDLVSDRLLAMNVSLKHHGPHSLRHACATRLLAEGLSMKEIGDHLGHRKLDTARVYAKVNLSGLRQVANFDIGGVL